MGKIKIYHGSNVAIERPQLIVCGFYKDFGYGFYCTRFERQAQRWALTKRPEHVVSVYEYEPDTSLDVLIFPEMSEQWLEFIIACRRGIAHGHDIVEGPMADDQIWDYVEEYMEGSISRAAFWELAKFRYPTHQILFRTDSALRTLTHIGSYSL